MIIELESFMFGTSLRGAEGC